MASKIGKSKWYALIAIAGAIDIAQWLLDFAVGPGEAINEVADPIIGTLWAIYLQNNGVDIIHKWKRVGSLIGGTLAEMLSVSVLPAWFFDIWYIYSDVRSEDAEAVAQKEQEEMLSNNINQPLNKGGVRAPNQARNGQPTTNAAGDSKRKSQPPLYGGGRGQVGVGMARGKTNLQNAPGTKLPTAKESYMQGRKGADPDKDLADAQVALQKAQGTNNQFSTRDKEEAQRNIQSALDNKKLKQELGDNKYTEQHKAIGEQTWNTINKLKGLDG